MWISLTWAMTVAWAEPGHAIFRGLVSGAVVDALTDEAAVFLTPEWARANGALVIEDDYDGEFRYDRRPVGAMQPVATCEVYCGSVSKTLGPGLGGERDPRRGRDTWPGGTRAGRAVPGPG